MNVSVIVFPGTNCDHDIEHTYARLLDAKVNSIWHRETDLKQPDLVVLPGGFSYGDYLRAGALAKVSPIMESIINFANKGGPVLGICNGFQVLCEVGLLPGVLLQNIGMKFLSRTVYMKVASTDTPFTRGYQQGDLLPCPVAHFDGNFFADDSTIDSLEQSDQVIFRYSSPEGVVDPSCRAWNPNGSVRAIAGICNEKRNVLGFMPHPERALETLVSEYGPDLKEGPKGMELFRSALEFVG